MCQVARELLVGLKSVICKLVFENEQDAEYQQPKMKAVLKI